MKTKENIDSKKYNVSVKLKSAISLIVLVITIIVIIILATMVIVTLLNNNPINEANKARYESDRDNMQSIFTNTVAKVMAENQGSIKIEAGELNSVKSGVSSTTGIANYILEGEQDSSKASGTIEFDNKENEENKYYTGKKLPIYKAGETTWSVDKEGILKLQVGKEEYGNNGNNDGSESVTPPSVETITVSKEEYENLKTTVEALKKDNEIVKETIEDLKKNDDNTNKIIESLKNGINIDEIRVGEVTIGSVASNAHKNVKVNFTKPMNNTKYAVILTWSEGPAWWAQSECRSENKTINGFTVVAYNGGLETTGILKADYVVIPYT